MESHRKLYEGTCVNGPLQGRELAVRFPQGFIAVDQPNSAVWIYDYVDGFFVSRTDQPLPLEMAKKNKAMTGNDYDILAV